MKINIQLEISKELVDELIDAWGKGEGAPAEQIKASVITHIEKTIQSHRMRKAMESVREQHETVREAARNMKGLGIK